MNNPATDVNCRFLHTPEKGLVVECLRPISQGEQLFISYDNRPDDHLLLDYGFALGIGENSKTYLLFSMEEVNEVASHCFFMHLKLVENVQARFMSLGKKSLMAFILYLIFR